MNGALNVGKHDTESILHLAVTEAKRKRTELMETAKRDFRKTPLADLAVTIDYTTCPAECVLVPVKKFLEDNLTSKHNRGMLSEMRRNAGKMTPMGIKVVVDKDMLMIITSVQGLWDETASEVSRRD